MQRERQRDRTQQTATISDHKLFYINILGALHVPALRLLRQLPGRAEHVPHVHGTQSYTSKGIGSFVRNSYVSTIRPVVVCPYLCTSEARVGNLL